ncbi:hypothetical protein AZH53_08735 [Methanomicrobiaceae archaeon CYW5]|nr:hypothetical protein [Methanovulcanius yangii]
MPPCRRRGRPEQAWFPKDTSGRSLRRLGNGWPDPEEMPGEDGMVEMRNTVSRECGRCILIVVRRFERNAQCSGVNIAEGMK